MTNYGEIAEVWWDGACGEGPNGKKQVYDFAGCTKIVRELQPHAVATICGPDVRWVGNEDGLAQRPSGAFNQLNFPTIRNFVGSQPSATFRFDLAGFIMPTKDHQVKSLSKLLDVYYASIGRNAVLLLNIPPDRRGLFHENNIARLYELRAAIDETFKTNLAAGKPAKATSAVRWSRGGNGRRWQYQYVLDSCQRHNFRHRSKSISVSRSHLIGRPFRR